MVGRFETARVVEMTRKSGSEIGFVREYLSIHHNNTLKGGPRAMPSGVCQGRLFINAPCVSGEWHKQEFFSEEKCQTDAPESARGGSPTSLMSQSWVGFD